MYIEYKANGHMPNISMRFDRVRRQPSMASWPSSEALSGEQRESIFSLQISVKRLDSYLCPLMKDRGSSIDNRLTDSEGVAMMCSERSDN